MCDNSQIVRFWGGDMSYTNEVCKEGYLPAREFLYHVSQGDDNSVDEFGLFIKWQACTRKCSLRFGWGRLLNRAFVQSYDYPSGRGKSVARTAKGGRRCIAIDSGCRKWGNSLGNSHKDPAFNCRFRTLGTVPILIINTCAMPERLSFNFFVSNGRPIPIIDIKTVYRHWLLLESQGEQREACIPINQVSRSHGSHGPSSIIILNSYVQREQPI